MKNFESLFVAYLFVWAIFFAYHLTVARRLARLTKEVERLKETVRQS